MSLANSEQLKAIEHNGGVLLKAGAGSGKTFVLKEHMLFLSEKWINEFRATGNPISEFDIFIRSKFRKVILMTFTKKAAGELSIRLSNEFESKVLNVAEDVEPFWKIVSENLSYLSVSTIHGFCLKLIKLGLFAGVPTDKEVIFESEFRDLITKYFEDYIELNNENKTHFFELVIRQKKSLLNSLFSIFSDPTLRNLWDEEVLTNKKTINDIDEVCSSIFEILGFNDFFKRLLSVSDLEEFSNLKWYPFLKEFIDFKIGLNSDFAGVLKINDFFKSKDYTIPRKPSKKVPDHIVEYYEGVILLKDYLKKNGEVFSLYSEEFDSHINPWFEEIKKIVRYISKRYEKSSGLTFADLEYTVYKGLDDESARKLISDEFKYFIIDEFQDTSFIQFDIIKKIINNDYNRIFCVGDLKQAIYGFRGGELGVFKSCSTMVDKNLSLRNNYRSHENVINFNNLLFDFLFKKGFGFKGVDQYSVEVEYQDTPIQNEYKGSVYNLKVDLSFLGNEEKLSNLDIDYLEALALIEKIKLLQAKKGETAVLYKRLKPSVILTKLLMDKNIGFTAQLKIPFLEDPIIGIFKCLIEGIFDKNDLASNFQLLLLGKYFDIILGTSVTKITTNDLDMFYMNVRMYGLYESFIYLLDSKGIKNSNFSNNLKLIQSFIISSNSNLQDLLKLLNKQSEVSYSLDFQFGENASRVRLMSAHASKGLEFENVLIGGMYTNDSSIVNTSLIGKMPKSFKWTKSIHGKDKFKTPHFLLESLIEKQKDFAESKRLFYVANTRAMETLGWVDFQFNDIKRSKSSLSSWINGIKTWESSNHDFKGLDSESIDIKDDFNPSFLEELSNTKPLFHIDNLGISHVSNYTPKVYLPELSVTKLSVVAICPRKFYLQSICKISTDELDLINQLGEFEFNQESFDDDLLSSKTIVSSASRGTEIHEIISRSINEGFSENIYDLKSTDKKSIDWAVDNLKKYDDNYILISEKQIKFELLGYMISGIPDLILQPKQKKDILEVWDFKTGTSNKSKYPPYLYQ